MISDTFIKHRLTSVPGMMEQRSEEFFAEMGGDGDETGDDRDGKKPLHGRAELGVIPVPVQLSNF